MIQYFKRLFNLLMNKITINGVTKEVRGRNILVINDKIFVDNVLVSEGLSGIVKISFEGDLANLDATSVDVTGNVKGDIDGTTINVGGSVTGNIDGTTITIKGDVGGDVDGTSVEANIIKGNVDAVTVYRK